MTDYFWELSRGALQSLSFCDQNGQNYKIDPLQGVTWVDPIELVSITNTEASQIKK